MKRLTAILLLFIAACGSEGGTTLTNDRSHATTFESNTTYYVRLHFSQVAWDKPVAGVYAHLGVLTKADSDFHGGGTFWQDVQHVQLTPGATGFTAKQVIS